MGLLRSVLVGLVLVILIIFIATIFSGINMFLDFGVSKTAEALNTSESTSYRDTAYNLLGTIGWVSALIVGGAMLVYGIHVKRR